MKATQDIESVIARARSPKVGDRYYKAGSEYPTFSGFRTHPDTALTVEAVGAEWVTVKINGHPGRYLLSQWASLAEKTIRNGAQFTDSPQ